MLIINSPTFGELVVPFTASTAEQYEANVPTYARDNMTTGTRDTVNSGAVIKSPVLDFSGMITNNTGGFLHDYDIGQIRQTLINIYQSSQLVSVTIGKSSGLANLFASNPITFNNAVIQTMEIHADNTTGDCFNLHMVLYQQILVSSVYNPQVINVPGNASGEASGSGHPSGTNVQKTSLGPQNNGTTNPVNGGTLEQDLSNLKQDLGGL